MSVQKFQVHSYPQQLFFYITASCCCITLDVRILEGYDLRVSGDDNIRAKIEDQIKSIEKEIKESIREEDIKKKIENAITRVIPEWRLNASHASELSRWIANGFIEKVSLETRIKNLGACHREQSVNFCSNG